MCNVCLALAECSWPHTHTQPHLYNVKQISVTNVESVTFRFISTQHLSGHCATVVELGGSIAAWAGTSLLLVRIVSDHELDEIQSCGRCLVYYVHKPNDAAGVRITLCHVLFACFVDFRPHQPTVVARRLILFFLVVSLSRL